MFAVFLDIKRAYSITWKHGIPMILYYIGLRIHPKLKVNATKGLFSIFFYALFWGADRTTLLRLYRALIHNKLDYGC